MSNNGSPEMEDEETNPHVLVEYFDSPPPPASGANAMPASAMSNQIDEEEAKQNAMEHLVNPDSSEKEEVRQASIINKSLVREDALKNINRIAQDKQFKLSSKCKTFFSDLENTGAKCFNEFITEAKKFNNSDSNVNELAESARQRAAAT
jgi:hypothetical protein